MLFPVLAAAGVIGPVLLLAATLGAPAPRAELRIVEGVSIATLDPAQISWLQDIRVVIQLYEGIFVPSPSGGVQPGCAELIGKAEPDVFARQRTYQFAIRPGSCWSNGDPLTADDFLFAWRRAIEPGTAKDYAFFLDSIRGVPEYVAWRHSEIARIGAIPASARPGAVAAHLREADARFVRGVGLGSEGPAVLRVELSRPVAYWPELLAYPVFLPLHRASVERFRRVGESGVIYTDPRWCKPGNTVYNGPYELEGWRFKRGLRLRRNPFFREAARVRIDSIECADVVDPNTAWLMYDTGAVDWLMSLETSFAPELLARSTSPLPGALNRTGRDRRDIHAFPAFGTYFYNLNCAERLPDGTPNPLADARIRRAICCAVDRESLCREVTRRGEPAATTLIPPGMIPGYPAPAGLSYDPARARRLLAEAGHADGFSLPEISLLFNTEAEHGLIAQSVAAMLRQSLGLRVRLVGKEAQTYREDKKQHAFMLARASWYGDYADPTSFLSVFTSGNGNNDSAYADPTYDRLLAAADARTEARSRLRALADCEHFLLTTGASLLPLFHYVNIYAFDPERLRGVTLNPRLVIPYGALEVRR